LPLQVPLASRAFWIGVCGSERNPGEYQRTPRKHGLRFHDLRHTCAALLIAADAHPKAIQDHLGHRDIQTTFNVYGHMLPAAQEALAAALDTAYEGSAEPDEKEELPRIGRG
jgi:integrase